MLFCLFKYHSLSVKMWKETRFHENLDLETRNLIRSRSHGIWPFPAKAFPCKTLIFEIKIKGFRGNVSLPPRELCLNMRNNTYFLTVYSHIFQPFILIFVRSIVNIYDYNSIKQKLQESYEIENTKKNDLLTLRVAAMVKKFYFIVLY